MVGLYERTVSELSANYADCREFMFFQPQVMTGNAMMNRDHRFFFHQVSPFVIRVNLRNSRIIQMKNLSRIWRISRLPPISHLPSPISYRPLRSAELSQSKSVGTVPFRRKSHKHNKLRTNGQEIHKKTSRLMVGQIPSKTARQNIKNKGIFAPVHPVFPNCPFDPPNLSGR